MKHTFLVQRIFLVCLSFASYHLTKVSSMQAVQFNQGGPENLHIAETPVPQLRQNEVLVKVHFSALNRADTLQRQGKYPPPAGESEILGLEASGVVDSLGPGVTKCKVGDRVMALLPGGGNAEYVAAREDQLMQIPSGMSFATAAAIPEVWLTAYQLIHFVGKMTAGETVLVHAGGSGVGTAAVQLIRMAGGVSIVTAGSQAKIDVAKSLGAAEGFNYKEGNFADKVMAYTTGVGVDMVLDCVGGSMWEQNAAVLRVDGRWVQYGLLGGANVNGPILSMLLRKRISLLGTVLRSRSNQYKAELVADFTQKALPGFSDGRLKTIIDSTFPLGQIADAHRKVESNQNTGKVLLQVVAEGDKHEL